MTDTVIGTANLALTGVNNHIRAFNLVAGTNCPTLKIPAPDWSRGLAIEEGGEPGSWSDTHGWSKFSAGVGLDAALAAASLGGTAAGNTRLSSIPGKVWNGITTWWKGAPKTAPQINQYFIQKGKAPQYVEPGIRELRGEYINDLGQVQPWKAHYDEYGRLIGRTDFNAGNKAAGIPNIHYEVWEYNAQYPKGIKIQNHVPGEYTP